MKKIGVIGVGNFGQFLLKAYSEISEAKLEGICGKSNKERLKRIGEKYSIPKISLNYKEFVKNDFDIIVIATPPFLHSEMAIAALEKGKNVLVEKPLAINLKQGNKVGGVLKKNKKKLKIDYILRENPIIKKLKKIVDEGIFGRVQNLDFRNYASDSHLSKNHWFWDKKKSGGIWIEHGVHFFDLFSYLLNKTPEDFLSAGFSSEEVEDQVSCICNYGGALANFTHSFTKPREIENTSFTLSFDKGKIDVKGWIPMEMRVSGLVNKGELKKIKKIIKVKEERFNERVRGRRKEYMVIKKIEGEVKLRDRGEVYKESIKRVMEKFIDNLNNDLEFGFLEALESLKSATEAEKSKSLNKLL